LSSSDLIKNSCFFFQPDDGVTISLESSSSATLLSCLVPIAMSASNQVNVNNHIKVVNYSEFWDIDPAQYNTVDSAESLLHQLTANLSRLYRSGVYELLVLFYLVSFQLQSSPEGFW